MVEDTNVHGRGKQSSCARDGAVKDAVHLEPMGFMDLISNIEDYGLIGATRDWKAVFLLGRHQSRVHALSTPSLNLFIILTQRETGAYLEDG